VGLFATSSGVSVVCCAGGRGCCSSGGYMCGWGWQASQGGLSTFVLPCGLSGGGGVMAAGRASLCWLAWLEADWWGGVVLEYAGWWVGFVWSRWLGGLVLGVVAGRRLAGFHLVRWGVGCCRDRRYGFRAALPSDACFVACCHRFKGMGGRGERERRGGEPCGFEERVWCPPPWVVVFLAST